MGASVTPGQPAYLMAPGARTHPTPPRTGICSPVPKPRSPAIGAAREALPANAVGPAFIELARPDDEIEPPAEVQVRWIYRGGRADLVPEDVAGDHAPLIAVVKEASWQPGRVQVFIHGEAQTVMHNLRPYIRKSAAWTDHQLRPHRTSVLSHLFGAAVRHCLGRRACQPDTYAT